jgi:hypothetical protein
MSIEFDEIVSGSSPKIQEIARSARNLIYSLLPGVVEVVWAQQRIAGYGHGPRKMTEQFCYIAPYKNHVNLGFYYGGRLEDPDNLLEGTGKDMRHVKIRDKADLEKPAIVKLVRKAIEERRQALNT